MIIPGHVAKEIKEALYIGMGSFSRIQLTHQTLPFLIIICSDTA